MGQALQQDQNDTAGNPQLPAALHPLIEEFLEDRALVHQLADAFGSPLNIIFPEIIDENIADFERIYKKHVLKGRIFFTCKPNKSKSIAKRASLSNVGMDISSTASLHHAMASGFHPSRMEATGPKNIDYLTACLQMNVLINADSMAELQTITRLQKKLGLPQKAQIMVRLCDFQSDRAAFTPQDSTFGIPVADVPEIISFLLAHKDTLDFKGFSFHASRMNDQLRLTAIENTLSATFHAIERGLKPTAINIGGGFPIRYAQSQSATTDYIDALKHSILHETESLTWNKDGLGFRKEKDGVNGSPRFMEQYPARAKGEELDHWLSMRSPVFGNAALADIIRDSLLELYIEPGRGLLDQCGVTIGRVAFTKKSAWGEHLIGLEMNQTNLHAANMKQLCAPIIIPRGRQPRPANDKGVYYMGNLCMAYDILQYNKTFPPVMPQTGDLVAFANTAAYAMDFMESGTLMNPVAEKIAVWKRGDAFHFATDARYAPVIPEDL